MGIKLDLDYFTGREADQFNFIKIPKTLLHDPAYKPLKMAEIIVYSMMLDRMSLSMKNGWFDELGRAYIFCSIEDVKEFADCGKNKAVDILKALEEIGLIEKVKGAPGQGTKIYVKNFIPKDSQKFANQTFGEVTTEQEENIVGDELAQDEIITTEQEDLEISPEVWKSNHEKFENQTSRSPENKLLEVWKSNPNNTKYNNTKYSETESNQILSAGKSIIVCRDSEIRSDEIGYAKLIKDNIALDILLERYPFDKEFLEGVYDLILETVLCKSDTIVVASNEYSTNFVRSKLLKLNSMHIEYVLDSWKNNIEKPRNIKKYLLAVLFNAPSTIDAFYQAEVNHDMAHGTI